MGYIQGKGVFMRIGITALFESGIGEKMKLSLKMGRAGFGPATFRLSAERSSQAELPAPYGISVSKRLSFLRVFGKERRPLQARGLRRYHVGSYHQGKQVLKTWA